MKKRFKLLTILTIITFMFLLASCNKKENKNIKKTESTIVDTTTKTTTGTSTNTNTSTSTSVNSTTNTSTNTSTTTTSEYKITTVVDDYDETSGSWEGTLF